MTTPEKVRGQSRTGSRQNMKMGCGLEGPGDGAMLRV